MSAIVTLHNVRIKGDSVNLKGLDWRKEDGLIFPNQCSCLHNPDVESDIDWLAKRGAEGSVTVTYDEDGESEKWVLKDGKVGVYLSVVVYEEKPCRYLSTETLEEALRALDLHNINKALDKGWKPDMKDVRGHYATHMLELSRHELVEMYTSEVFGDDPSITKQVNGLSGYLEIAAGKFLTE